MRKINVFITALLTLLFCANVSFAEIPSTLGWYEIPNTNLRSVCPPNNFGNSGYDFASYCWGVTGAWNSGVFDTLRNRLIIWGGGHADYYGNEVYALDLDTLVMSRLNDPGLPLADRFTDSPNVCTEEIANGTQPNSRHTYDSLVYLPGVDKMFAYGGALSCRTSAWSSGTWVFDFATLKWQRLYPSGPIPAATPGLVTAYDPNTGKVFLHDYAYSDGYLYSYTYSTNSFQRLSNSNAIDYHMTGVIDPVRKKFVIIGGGQAWIHDISGSGSYDAQALSTTGGSAIINSDYPGLAYDPVTDRIVAWNGGNTVYSLNLDTKVWTSITYSGGPGAAIDTGTYKRWNYSLASGAFVVVNSVDNNAYSFRLTSSTPPTSQLFGLEWPGDGSVRRMLYWHNPFPIYDATYIFKVYPRKKTDAIHGYYKYYTTFFWGNDGTFVWDGGGANTYYGAHPYPIPAPTGPGQWEISVYGSDPTTGQEVQWNRWYTQAFRAWRESPSITHHEFYWDLPDTSKVLTYTINSSSWANKNPPTPSIVIGQAPDACGPPPGNCGASWGGYPGWEEFNGIIRGIQIYSNDLSLADIQSEIAVPKSTVAGQNSIWYLNLNPRPSDVTDKKATGTAHNPSWDGTTALEWSDQAPPPDTTSPSTPTNLSATAVSANQINLSWIASTDNVAVTGYKIYRGGTQIANSITNSYQDAGLFPSTTYTYTVSAFDAAGNNSAQSIAVSATTPTGPPPTLGLLASYAFNEGTGTSTTDFSGNNNTGSISGATWTTSGKYSNSLSFDGLNDKVSLPAISISLPFTIEAWIYPASFTDWRAIFSKRTGPSNAYFDLGLSNASGNVYIYTGSVTNFSYVPPLNTWTHLAAVLTSSSSQLYVNGSLNQTLGAVTLGAASSAPASIGNTPDDDDPFAGRIDELRIYNRALTQPEIQADMNTPIGVTTEGDVNQDSSVDILDIQALVNHILGTQDYGASADVNSDGSVDVLDVQEVVNIILGV